MKKSTKKAIALAAAIANGTAIALERNEKKLTSAILVCAGNSSRMGDKISKQLLCVQGIPVLRRTLSVFCNTECIHEIVVVAREEDFAAIRALFEEIGADIPFSLVAGGQTRALSVQNGFAAISPSAEFVAIHDGARCLITPEEIRAVCRAAYRTKAATASHTVSDSVKLANKRGYIKKSIDRSAVRLVQTPQVFSTDLYRAALATAADTIHVTDDNALMEQIRYPVKLVDCSADNIKITFPGDIEKAEFILKKRGEA